MNQEIPKLRPPAQKKFSTWAPKVQYQTKNNMENIKRKEVISILNYFSKIVSSVSRFLSNTVLASSLGTILPLCEPPWVAGVQPRPAAGSSWSWLALGLLDIWEAFAASHKSHTCRPLLLKPCHTDPIQKA